MNFLDISRDIQRLARARNLRITTAESCTGGLLAGAITEAAGASDIFERGFITYSNTAKTDLLGVQPETLDQFGAVSPQVALEMAVRAQKAARTDIAVSVTGIAGPGPSEHKPEGRVCFALVQSGQPEIAQTVEFGAIGRAAVRRAAVLHALQMLLGAVNGDQNPRV